MQLRGARPLQRLEPMPHPQVGALEAHGWFCWALRLLQPCAHEPQTANAFRLAGIFRSEQALLQYEIRALSVILSAQSTTIVRCVCW